MLSNTYFNKNHQVNKNIAFKWKKIQLILNFRTPIYLNAANQWIRKND